MSLSDKLGQYLPDLHKENVARINEVSAIYERSLREVLGVQGTPDHPSKPGEAPHRVTGRLQASVFSEVDASSTTVRAGTAAKYTEYLLPKRNYYKLAFDKVAGTIRAKLLQR